MDIIKAGITMEMLDKLRGEIIHDVPEFDRMVKHFGITMDMSLEEATECVKQHGTVSEQDRQFLIELEQINELSPNIRMTHVYMMID